MRAHTQRSLVSVTQKVREQMMREQCKSASSPGRTARREEYYGGKKQIALVFLFSELLYIIRNGPSAPSQLRRILPALIAHSLHRT